MARIETKREMYSLQQANRLGNHLQMWDGLNSYIASGYPGEIGLRYAEAGKRCEYNIAAHDVEARLEQWGQDGLERNKIMICEMAPHKEHGTISGEICLSPDYYWLHHTTGRLPMREAYAEKWPIATGLQARMIVEHYMDQASLETLHYLLELYPDSIIEFSCFDIGVGIAGCNTIFWEVRNY